MRTVSIHDTLSGAVLRARAADAGPSAVYACGPTVYAPVHVGNARPFVIFALLKRFLQREGYGSRWSRTSPTSTTRSTTRLGARGWRAARLRVAMTERYVSDTDRLGLGRPDREPRATEAIDAIVSLIAELLAKDHAYAADGDVYFRVGSFPSYGRLSNRGLEEMVQGEGDEARADLKESPQDFALWKARKPDEDTCWAAPWGEGRPGWHIECSAMAESILGLDFDVHGGGLDLVFPHHENEIAQTESARGERLARIWMHNGMVQLDEAKMSKSEGNIQLLGEALDRFGRDAVVMYFVGGHYRAAARVLARRPRGSRAVGAARARLPPPARSGRPRAAGLPTLTPSASTTRLRTTSTPPRRARSSSTGWRRETACWTPAEPLGCARFAELLWTLGLERLADVEEDGPDAEAERLLSDRETARAARDYATADARRAELEARGWEVRDTPEGPHLVRRA